MHFQLVTFLFFSIDHMIFHRRPHILNNSISSVSVTADRYSLTELIEWHHLNCNLQLPRFHRNHCIIARLSFSILLRSFIMYVFEWVIFAIPALQHERYSHFSNNRNIYDLRLSIFIYLTYSTRLTIWFVCQLLNSYYYYTCTDTWRGGILFYHRFNIETNFKSISNRFLWYSN